MNASSGGGFSVVLVMRSPNAGLSLKTLGFGCVVAPIHQNSEQGRNQYRRLRPQRSLSPKSRQNAMLAHLPD